MVSFGEVMAGLQAGFTGGSVVSNDNNGEPTPLPSGVFLAASAVDTRGFIDPETGTGYKCDSEWGVVILWLATSWGTDRNPTQPDARDFSEGVILDVTIEVTSTSGVIETVQLEVIETASRIGTTPGFLGLQDSFTKTWGGFLEPDSLDPGTYEASIVGAVDFDCIFSECDGVADAIVQILAPATFEVIAD